MRTKKDMEAEIAELRGQVAALRGVVEKLLSQPPVQQFVPMPCPLPHYPQPTVNPGIWRPWTDPNTWSGASLQTYKT